jgi:hypothetical protein
MACSKPDHLGIDQARDDSSLLGSSTGDSVAAGRQARSLDFAAIPGNEATMKEKLLVLLPLAVCYALLPACGNSDSAGPDPAKTGAPAQSAGSTAGGQLAAAPVGSGAPATPQPTAAAKPVGYSLADIKTIPDSCASPLAILATAPASVGDKYAWPISRQALLANQQFRVTSGDPAVPGEVRLATHKYGDSSYALVATCKDGGTCNNVAAMYKAIVRSSNPQLACGKMNGISAAPVGSFSWPSDPKQSLPKASDVTSACARLSACMIATDRATPGDPFAECQKGPSSFKIACADRYPCSEVLACAGR